MANVIEQIKVNDTTYNIASTAYVECESGASTVKKTADLSGFKLTKGVTVHVKFINNNTATNPSLNINGTGDVLIKQFGTTAAAGTDETSGWKAGAVVSLTYDGTNWVRDQGYNTNTTYTVKDTYSGTDGNPISGKGVKAAIDGLDVSNITSNLAVSKTITALSETDGKIAATASDIQIAESQVTNLTSDLALKAPIASPTFTGTVTLPGDPTSDLQAATKKYVDDKTASLTGAMHLLGITTTDISTGTANTTATVSIGGSNKTAVNGDVVLYGNQEYVWANNKWNLLGDEGSYALDADVVKKSDYNGAGKILYGTGSGTYNALTGNNTTTKKVLIMTSNTPSWSTLGISAGTGSFPSLNATITTEFLTASNAALTTGTAYSIPNVTKMATASVDENAVLIIESGTMGTNISVTNITGIDKTKKAAAATAVSLSGGSWPSPSLTYN